MAVLNEIPGSKLTQAQADELASLCDEYDLADAQRRTEHRAEVERTYRAGGTVNEPGDGATRTVNIAARHVDTGWDDPSARRNADESRDAALASVELMQDGTSQPEDREFLSNLIRHSDDDGKIAQWARVASSPIYAEAFRKYMAGASNLWSDKEREAVQAVQSAAIAQDFHNEQRADLTESAIGSFALPIFLDQTVQLSSAGAIPSAIRQVARVETISSYVFHGISSAGTVGRWDGEAAEVENDSPTLAQTSITPQRLTSYSELSYEVTQDSTYLAQMGRIIADAITVAESSAFATGDGSLKHFGAVTRLSAVTTSRVTSNTQSYLNTGDLRKTVQSLSPRWQPNAAWVTSYTTEQVIRGLQETASGGQSTVSSSFWATLGQGEPDQLLGRALYPDSGFQSTATWVGNYSGSTTSEYVVVLADWQQLYAVVDRIGTFVQVNPWVVGANRRPLAVTGVLAFKRVGGDTLVNDAGRLLLV